MEHVYLKDRKATVDCCDPVVRMVTGQVVGGKLTQGLEEYGDFLHIIANVME